MDVDRFCKSKAIKHEFSTPTTPQQNEVVERKNKVLQEMARVMIHIHNTLMQFWAKTINTTCYTTNRIFLRPETKKTSYKLWIGRKPNLKYFRIFGSEYYILKDGENLGKFNAKFDVIIFLGYSTTSKAYRFYNQNSQIGQESSNMVINNTRYDQDIIESQILTQDPIGNNP